MKKSHLLLIFTLSLLLFQTSCKKDDEPAPDPIIGKWKMDRYTLTYPANSGFEDLNGEFTPDAGGISSYIIDFKADKTFASDYRAGQIVKETGEWVKNNNEVTLTYDDNTSTEEEYTLSTDNKELSRDFKQTTYFRVDADTVAVERTVGFIFEKQN